MAEIPVNPALVAACGLYCGACPSYLKGRCPGCAENTRASGCPVRSCAKEQGISGCAQCSRHPDPVGCAKFNSPTSKVFSWIFRSNRAACVAQLREVGAEEHARRMAALGRPSLPR